MPLIQTGNFTNLNAVNAHIDNLVALRAFITDLIATNANISVLRATQLFINGQNVSGGVITDVQGTGGQIVSVCTGGVCTESIDPDFFIDYTGYDTTSSSSYSWNALGGQMTWQVASSDKMTLSGSALTVNVPLHGTTGNFSSVTTTSIAATTLTATTATITNAIIQNLTLTNETIACWASVGGAAVRANCGDLSIGDLLGRNSNLNIYSLNATYPRMRIAGLNASAATGAFVTLSGGDSGNSLLITADSDSVGVNHALMLSSIGNSTVRLRANRGVNDVLVARYVTNGVNYAQVVASITGASPLFSVDGTDSNVDATLVAKGSGSSVNLNTGGTGTTDPGQRVMRGLCASPPCVNFLTLTATQSGSGTVNLQATPGPGGDTNLDFTVAGTGTGSTKAVRFYADTISAGGTPFSTTAGDMSCVRLLARVAGADLDICPGLNTSPGLRVLFTSGAVNYGRVNPSTTGNTVGFSAGGTDTNIGCALIAKGTGSAILATGNGSNNRFICSGSTGICNAPQGLTDTSNRVLTTPVAGNGIRFTGTAPSFTGTNILTATYSAPGSQAFGGITSNGNYGILLFTVTTAAGATCQTATVTNSEVTSVSVVGVWEQGYSGTANDMRTVKRFDTSGSSSGSFTIQLCNNNAVGALSGTIAIGYMVAKA